MQVLGSDTLVPTTLAQEPGHHRGCLHQSFCPFSPMTFRKAGQRALVSQSHPFPCQLSLATITHLHIFFAFMGFAPNKHYLSSSQSADMRMWARMTSLSFANWVHTIPVLRVKLILLSTLYISPQLSIFFPSSFFSFQLPVCISRLYPFMRFFKLVLPGCRQSNKIIHTILSVPPASPNLVLA